MDTHSYSLSFNLLPVVCQIGLRYVDIVSSIIIVIIIIIDFLTSRVRACWNCATSFYQISCEN